MKSNFIIAVLLTCHNRREMTLACLNSLYRARLPEGYRFDVYLVDDGSTDETGEAVKEEFPSVNVIQGTGNLYWNRGMYLAWDVASKNYDYDYYVWLNDDVVLFATAVSDLIEASKQKANVIIGGTMQSGTELSPTYGGRNKEGELLVPNGTLQACYVVNGNLVLIPRSVFKVVGKLDKKFPHSMGDYDYILRAKRMGIVSYICPGYSGICEEHDSLAKWCLPEVPFLSRLKSLYSPLGNSHPYYYFQYERRHFGLCVALKHFLSIHLRVIWPNFYLWRS